MPNPLLKFHSCYLEALSLFEILRKSGFSSEQIYFYPYRKMNEISLTILVTGKHYPIRVTDWPAGVTVGELQEEWRRAAAMWNDLEDDSFRQEIFESSEIRKTAVLIIAQLEAADLLPRRGDA